MNFLEPLNNLIKLAEDAEMSQFVYEAWNVVNIAVTSLFCLSYRKHYNIKKSQALLIPLLMYLIGDAFILLLGWIAMGFSYFGSNNIVKGFSFFPLIGLLVSKIFKIEWKRIMDFCAPAFPLLQCVAHIACNFAGCCHGYPMEGGIWNPSWNQYLFPAQLLESLVSFLIFIACLIYAKKQNYKVTGTVYPFFLVTFGTARFFLEFTRANAKLFWGISDLALWALLMVIIGIVWFIKAGKGASKKSK